MTADSFGIAFPGQGAKREAIISGLREHRRHPMVKLFFKTFRIEDPETLDFTDTAVAQPVTYALGLAEFERSLGSVRPKLVLGHSLGELTAAAQAGILDAEAGFHLAVRRGALCHRQNVRRPGAMVAVIGTDPGDIEWLRRRVLAAGDVGILEIAAMNSRRQVVLSGDLGAVREVVRLAQNDYLRTESLPIGGAFHSPIMYEVMPDWAEAVEAVDFRPSKTVFISTVDARVHTDPVDVRNLLIRALLLPVRWRDSVKTAKEQGITSLWDAGPGDALLKLGRRERLLNFGSLRDAVPAGR